MHRTVNDEVDVDVFYRENASYDYRRDNNKTQREPDRILKI